MATTPFGATSATWSIDPSESAANFTGATLWGRVPVNGRLGEVSGQLEWDGASGEGRLAIATTGLSSGIGLRDHHLRGRDFFAAQDHPEVEFDATEVVVDDSTVQLRGDLLVRGERHPFTCTAATTRLSDDRVALEASATLDLESLGMSRGLMRMVSANVTADVRVVIQRSDP